jgi:hypothetical protein
MASVKVLVGKIIIETICFDNVEKALEKAIELIMQDLRPFIDSEGCLQTFHDGQIWNEYPQDIIDLAGGFGTDGQYQALLAIQQEFNNSRRKGTPVEVLVS